MTIRKLMKKAVSSPGTLSRLRAIGGMFSLLVIAGCASQGPMDSYSLVQTSDLRCPAKAIPYCEVTGGNKFKKRYGRCVCARPW